MRLIFSRTSEDHNFCSCFQNYYYFIYISGGIRFPPLVKLALPVCKLRFCIKSHFLHFSNIFCDFSSFFRDFCSGSYGACFDLKFFPPTSKTLNLMGKIAGAVGMVWVGSFKKIMDWFLVKLQRTITFALVIRITIILYAFRVKFDFSPCRNWLCWFANSNSPENSIFYISVMFFVIFLHFLRILFWYLRCLFWLKTFYPHF